MTLAPLYDVATGLIPDAAGRLRYPKGAMSVGGERRFGDVERSHWEKFARVLGLPPTLVVDWVDELSRTIPPAFEQAAAETGARDADFLAGTVTDNIRAVAERTREGLASANRTRGRLGTPFMDTLRRAQNPSTDVEADASRPAVEADLDDTWGA